MDQSVAAQPAPRIGDQGRAARSAVAVVLGQRRHVASALKAGPGPVVQPLADLRVNVSTAAGCVPGEERFRDAGGAL